MKNFTEFLAEAPRVVGVEPTKDAKPEEKSLASRDTSKRKAVSRVAKELGVTGNYANKVSAIAGVQEPDPAPDDPDLQSAKRFGVMKAPGGRAASEIIKAKKKELAKEKGIKAADVTPEQEIEIADKEIEGEKLSTAQRMDRAAKVIGPQGKLTGDFDRNRAVNKAIRRGYGAQAKPGFDIPGGAGRVQDIPAFRHLMQPDVAGDIKPDNFPDPSTLDKSGMWTDEESGLSYHHDGTHWRQEMSPDDALTLLGNTRDERISGTLSKDAEGNVRTKVTPAGKAWGENPQTQKPSAEEMKTWSKESLENAFKSGEISKERYERSKTLIKAFGDEDPKTVQDLSFSRYVGEEGQNNEAITEFLDSTEGIDNLVNSGLGAEREKAAYGGDLGKMGEKYRVPGAPAGVYDLSKMKKGDKQLYKLAMQNRLQELVRTYLKQDGENAYSWWEGKRSINDMNLEHIMSLANGGYDHPSNWVWSGEELNKLKNEFDLSDRAATIEKPEYTTVRSGKSYTSIRNQMAKQQGKNAKQMEAELSAAIPELKMNQKEYMELSDKEIDDARERARKAGYPEEEIENDLPKKVTTRPGFEGGKNETEYEEWRLEQERNRQIKDSAMNKIRQQQGLKSFDDAARTPEGREVLATLSTPRWKQETTTPDIGDDDDTDI